MADQTAKPTPAELAAERKAAEQRARDLIAHIDALVKEYKALSKQEKAALPSSVRRFMDD